jgi:hypothetical protein
MPMKSLTGAMRRPFRTHPVLSVAHIGDMVGYFSVSSPPCSCTKIGKRPTAEFAKQMLQMPGVVSSLPPLEADAFHMAKTDDDFHLKCPTEFARGDYPALTLAARRPPNPDRLGPYVLRPLVAVPSATSKTYKSLLVAVSSSTINKPSEYMILKLPPFFN